MNLMVKCKLSFLTHFKAGDAVSFMKNLVILLTLSSMFGGRLTAIKVLTGLFPLPKMLLTRYYSGSPDAEKAYPLRAE